MDRLMEVISSRLFRKVWWLFIIIFFITIVIIPTIWILSYVLTDWSSIQKFVLDDPEVMGTITDAIIASFEIAAIVTVIDIIVGLPMAWVLVRKEFRGKRYLDTLIDMPLAVPTAALGFSCAIFWAVTPSDVHAPDFALGLIDSAFVLIILLHVVFSYPYMVRSLAAILEQIDVTYETAGRVLGASRLTAARTITLPMFRAGLVTGIILCLARSLSETGGTMIALATMANAGGFETGPTIIGKWKKLVQTNPDIVPQLAFVSILLIAISLVLLVVLKVIVMKVRLPAGKVWPKWERTLSRGWAPFLKDSSSTAFLFIFVLIPSFFIFSYVIVLPYQSAEWARFWDSLMYSFVIAGVVTLIDIVMGVPMALYLARGHGSRLAQGLDVLVNVPLIVPTAALGYSLGVFWSDISGAGSLEFLLVVMAHVAFTYPLVVRNVAGAVEEIDPSFEETARTLGAKPTQAFKRVLYPMIKTSILAGAIMAFTRSLGETGATLAVVADANTAPVYIVNLINAEQFYLAGLACIVLIIVSYIFMLLLRYVTKRRAG
ncbi:MAG: iron ABC transporter permease [Methanomassiliicoccales archaeon]|nr:MAG: iron ABC transporter permease [Methanomassiliicoccales archaeon]